MCSPELTFFRAGACGGLASSVGLLATVVLGSWQKRPQTWSYPRGLARSCWLVPGHFLWLRSRERQVRDTWRVAPLGLWADRWLIKWERGVTGLAGLVCSRAARQLAPQPFHPVLHYSPFCPRLSPGTMPWTSLQGNLVLCRHPHTHSPSWRRGQPHPALPAQTLGRAEESPDP